MKHRAAQFEIPGAAAVFNLAAEIIREEPPQAAAKQAAPDPTPNLFGPCPQFRPYRRDDGSYTRRCADCGAFESEHEQKPETRKEKAE